MILFFLLHYYSCAYFNSKKLYYCAYYLEQIFININKSFLKFQFDNSFIEYFQVKTIQLFQLLNQNV